MECGVANKLSIFPEKISSNETARLRDKKTQEFHRRMSCWNEHFSCTLVVFYGTAFYMKFQAKLLAFQVTFFTA